MPAQPAPRYTPWGLPQTTKQVADGIYCFTTPEHGGFWIDDSRWAEFQQRYPQVELWAGPQWFEEDSDWAFVAACWPEFFTPNELAHSAKEVARRLAPAPAAQ